jgi:hypothetical protein
MDEYTIYILSCYNPKTINLDLHRYSCYDRKIDGILDLSKFKNIQILKCSGNTIKKITNLPIKKKF